MRVLVFAMFQAADRKQAAGSRTYHSPHAVRGGGADRVVVGVCCCIDSAVAAWNGEETVMHACSVLEPRVNSFKSRAQSITSLVGPPGGPHITQGASERRVQRLAISTCPFIVILISWVEWVMSTKRALQREHARCWGVGLGSRPCLFIVAGSELILPISFRDRTRCVGFIYIFIRLHIFLYLLSFFSALACK